MHPAERCTEYVGDLLEKYSGDSNLTFLDLYQRYGTELCITVSNLSRQQMEFFHVKTTPEVPIKFAIRASMSVPCLWEPIELWEGEIDGGLYNNYPLKVSFMCNLPLHFYMKEKQDIIHLCVSSMPKAFDGWFLSVDRDDGVLPMMAEASSVDLNEKTENYHFVRALRKCLATSYDEPNMVSLTQVLCV